MHLLSRARGTSRVALPMAVAGALVLSCTVAANAATTNPDPGSLELTHAALSKKAATEGMVLLENKDEALPIARGGNVAVFGVGAYRTVKGGTGSGDVNNRYNVTVRQGTGERGFSVTTSGAYWSPMVTAADALTSGGGGPFAPPVNYSAAEQALTEATVQPTAPTDTAVFVIARNSGEFADRTAGKGDYELADLERANIELLGKTYKNVIVVLNVGGIINTSFYPEINAAVTTADGGPALDAMLLMSQAGQEGGNALADVLTGVVSPSGKLTDTWAAAYNYYPAASTFGNTDSINLQEAYDEGIYVGYRWFDAREKLIDATATGGRVVNYPFGYGLSYTDFVTETQSVTADADKVTVKTKVTNVGAATGKHVVEVYVSAPQTGLDKPYQELAGYGKTDALAPGASQVVTVSFATAELSSYDEDSAAYVLDAGKYLVRVGDSSRDTHVAASLKVANHTVVEQLSNQLDVVNPLQVPALSEIESDPANFYSYEGEGAEVGAAPSLAIDLSGFVASNNASELDQDVVPAAGSPLSVYEAPGRKIASTTAYLDPDNENWEGRGTQYQAKEGESREWVETDPASTLFDVAKGSTTMEQFVAGLSVTELANVVEGANFGSAPTALGAAGYTTARLESKGIPGMTLADGPAGLRITREITSGTRSYQFATAFPIGTLLAQSWNADLVKEVGQAIGAEMKEYGVSLWLAPGQNIHRNPLNGRNFEYYSEDPLITGITSMSTTAGVQSVPGVGVTIKHYAANSQETNRNNSSSNMSERAMREIYLKGFEISVKGAQPMAIMSAYNKINGQHTAASYDLDTDILRGEWGFDGVMMSDWGSVSQATALGQMYAGNDLIMPGNNVSQITSMMYRADPNWDVTGLPVYTTDINAATGAIRYAWQFGGWTLSATGVESKTTTVDAASIAEAPKSGAFNVINNFTPLAKYATVDAAYAAVKTLLNPATVPAPVNATQRAAITVNNEVYTTPGDSTTPLVSFDVTVKGNHSATAAYNLRLGDLQRSAMRVLDTASKSTQFKTLATAKGVSGITVGSYTGSFDNLVSPLNVAKGRVVTAQSGVRPQVSLSTGTPVPASGWVNGPVVVSATADTEDVLIDVDGAGFQPYDKPVTVTGEGEHRITALARSEAGVYSTLASTEFSIDTTAPAARVVSKTNAKLALAASDAASGVKSVQYKVAGAASWATYTAPVTIAGAPKAVTYRAIDVAGNTSAVGTVTVEGVQALSTPTLVGTVVVGKTVTAKVATSTAGATLAYTWKVNGTVIAGATKSSYAIKAADQGKKLSVTVRATKTGYTPIAKASSGKTVLGALVLTTPYIKGTVAVGKTVTASVTTKTSGATLSYLWKLDGKAITGARKPSYVIKSADKGKKLTVTVTEKKSGYLTITKTSASKTVK